MTALGVDVVEDDRLDIQSLLPSMCHHRRVVTKVVEVEPTSTAGLPLPVVRVPLTRCQIHLQTATWRLCARPSQRIPPHVLKT